MAVDCPPSSSTFVIVTPGYQQASGGIVALHNLCHRLNRLGRRAVLCPLDEGFQRREGWDTPLAIRADLDDAVVVYPEIIAGNPLQADRVVRWLLNRPGYISGQSMQEEPTDLIVSYSASIDPDRPLLSLPVIDPSIYFPKDVPGSGSLLWVGKGTGRTSMDLSGCREITRTWPATKADLAAVLRGADVLYSLDSLSAVNVEATLCGTPVVLFPDASWDRDALTRYEGGTAGFAWPGEGSGSDELAAARTAVLDAYPAYLQRLSGVDQGVAEFVRHCDEFFGDRVRWSGRRLPGRPVPGQDGR